MSEGIFTTTGTCLTCEVECQITVLLSTGWQTMTCEFGHVREFNIVYMLGVAS